MKVDGALAGQFSLGFLMQLQSDVSWGHSSSGGLTGPDVQHGFCTHRSLPRELCLQKVFILLPWRLRAPKTKAEAANPLEG